VLKTVVHRDQNIVFHRPQMLFHTVSLIGCDFLEGSGPTPEAALENLFDDILSCKKRYLESDASALTELELHYKNQLITLLQVS
jgi:hypothetical protein